MRMTPLMVAALLVYTICGVVNPFMPFVLNAGLYAAGLKLAQNWQFSKFEVQI